MESKVDLSTNFKNSIIVSVPLIIENINNLFVSSLKVYSILFHDSFISILLTSVDNLFISHYLIQSVCEFLNFSLPKLGLISLNCRFLGFNFHTKTISFCIDL